MRASKRVVIGDDRSRAAVEIDFAPHPNFAGELVLFTPQSGRRMKRTQARGIHDDFAVVFGASNVLGARS